MAETNTAKKIEDISQQEGGAVGVEGQGLKDLFKDDVVTDLKIRRAKGSKNIATGICYIIAKWNNTIVTFTDLAGNTISWSSAGHNKFKGSKKSTSYAAQVAVTTAAKAAMAHGLKEVVKIFVKGPGAGRDSAIKALQALGLINSNNNECTINDITPEPHGGVRQPSPRRV